MKVLILGTGGVGEAIAVIAKKRDSEGKWLETMVLSDYSLSRAVEVAEKLGDPKRFPSEKVDAGNKNQVATLVKKYNVDLILNACAPEFNMPIFDAAYDAGVNYLDMAMSLSQKDPKEPFKRINIKLGDHQFAKTVEWEKKNILALVGSGVEPGMADIFARYASDHLFDTVEELNVRDGANIEVRGYETAFGFSIWTTIEECLNPPVVWERERGWFVTEPFSDPEVFVLPEGIGPVEMVNVEHEEVLLMPRYLKEKGLKRVTFKYGLGDQFIRVLKILKDLGLDRTEKIKIGNVEVAPRDVVQASAPDPARLGDRMFGKTCAGVWVKGIKEGKERSVYLYQVADSQECMKRFGCQAVVAQTAFNPVIMLELLAKGIWKGRGVQGPEYFPAEPFMKLMEEYGFPAGMMEMESPYRKDLEEKAFKIGF